jgi:type III secretion HrpO family protein
MPDYAELLDLSQTALGLTIALSLPTVAVAALVSLLLALFQAATQVNDMTLSHLPRFVAVAVTLALTGAWMGGELVSFAARVFSMS